ncbi:MAG: hypothetical protein JSS97_02760 [Actinobacteria bacterium]|nr:hypothetical protein [Actinomycetota bacterium]
MPAASPREGDPEAVAELVDVLLGALAALGEAGRPTTANRLAGAAYASLRRRDPEQAQRLNALMHRLVKREKNEREEPPCRPPTRTSTSATSRPPAATS